MDRTVKQRWIGGSALVLLLSSVPFYWYFRPDPYLEKMRVLQRELAAEETRKLPLADQYELRRQFQEQARQMSSRQQRVLANDRRRLLLEKIEQFLALSPDEQTAALDAVIDRLDGFRQIETAARQALGELAAASSPRRARPGTPDQRERLLKQLLDATTPQDRAAMAKFKQQLIDRLNARGITIPANYPWPDWL
jgi:hypothetical protein